MNITVDSAKSLLNFGALECKCAIGKNGVTADKREGDRKTPLGTFALRKVLYRGDRIEKPLTELPVAELHPDDGWCDDPADPAYNTLIKLPYPASAEKLWREDDLYDLIVTLGYNDDPVVPAKGSAIFFHIARENYSGTDGCIAVAKNDLLEILKYCNSETSLSVI